jgi:hypothetical protein
MNAHLEPAVAAKNKAEVLRILAQAQRQGRRGENRRIVLAAKGAGEQGGGVAPEGS